MRYYNITPTLQYIEQSDELLHTNQNQINSESTAILLNDKATVTVIVAVTDENLAHNLHPTSCARGCHSYPHAGFGFCQ